MLGEHDGVEFAYSPLDGIVDHKIIIGIGRLQLYLCPNKALLHLFRAVGSAAGQPLLEGFPARRRLKS